MNQAVNPFASTTKSTISMLASSMVQGIGALIQELRETREKRNYSQAEIAEMLSVSELEIDQLESRHHSPTLDLVVAYAMALKIHVDFVTEDGEEWARSRRGRHNRIDNALVEAWVSLPMTEQLDTNWARTAAKGMVHAER